MHPHTAPTSRSVGRRDRGAASAELVIATPFLLLLLMLIIQGALWAHATNIARAAAAAGMETARAHGSTPHAGETQAALVLAHTGPTLLTNVDIRAQRGPDQTRVQIRATAITLIPGLRLPISVKATGVTEVFRSDDR